MNEFPIIVVPQIFPKRGKETKISKEKIELS